MTLRGLELTETREVFARPTRFKTNACHAQAMNTSLEEPLAASLLPAADSLVTLSNLVSIRVLREVDVTRHAQCSWSVWRVGPHMMLWPADAVQC